jgi:hypothetical protein
VQYAMPVSDAQPRLVAAASCNPASVATSASAEARMSGISAIVAVPIQIVTQQPYPEVTYDRLIPCADSQRLAGVVTQWPEKATCDDRKWPVTCKFGRGGRI